MKHFKYNTGSKHTSVKTLILTEEEASEGPAFCFGYKDLVHVDGPCNSVELHTELIPTQKQFWCLGDGDASRVDVLTLDE